MNSPLEDTHKRVMKLDYYGQPYEAWEEIRRKPNKAELWERFKQSNRYAPRGNGHQDVPMERGEEYEQRKLEENE